MNKVTVKIDGMMCGMCEAHINDTIRRVFPDAKKVASSQRKGETVFLIDASPDEKMLKAAIDETGYEFKSMKTEPYTKKGFFKR